MNLKKPDINLTEAKVLSNFIIAYCVSILGIADGILQIRNANRSKRGRGVKRAWASFQIGTSTLLIGGTLVSHVSSIIIKNQHVIAPLSRIAIKGASGFAYAAYAWGLAIKAIYDLHKTVRKTDLAYLYEDKIKKMYYLRNVIFNEPNRDGIETVSNTYERLRRQAIAIGKQLLKDNINTTKHTEINLKEIINAIEESFKKQNSNFISAGIDITDTTLSRDEEKYIAQLKIRQQIKVRKQCVALTYSLLFAIGMTLTAISPFVPPLFFAGLTITLVSTLLKYTPLIYDFLNNRFATWYQKKYLDILRVFNTNNESENVTYLSLKEQQAQEKADLIEKFGFWGKQRLSPKACSIKKSEVNDFTSCLDQGEAGLLSHLKK